MVVYLYSLTCVSTCIHSYMCSVRGLGPRYGHGSTHRGLGGRGSGINDYEPAHRASNNNNIDNLNGNSSNSNRNNNPNNSRQSTPFQAFKAARLAVRPILHDDETATVCLDRIEEDVFRIGNSYIFRSSVEHLSSPSFLLQKSIC